MNKVEGPFRNVFLAIDEMSQESQQLSSVRGKNILPEILKHMNQNQQGIKDNGLPGVDVTFDPLLQTLRQI